MRATALVFALALGSSPIARAGSPPILFENRSGRVLCVGWAATLAATSGQAAKSEGWTCHPSGASFEKGFNSPFYMLAVELATGDDYVATHDLGLQRGTYWAAAGLDRSFELTIHVRADGYAYTYRFGGDDWLVPAEVSHADDLAIILRHRGFVPLRAYLLNPATHPQGVPVILGGD